MEQVQIMFFIVFPLIVMLAVGVAQWFAKNTLLVTGVAAMVLIAIAIIVNKDYLVFSMLYYFAAFIAAMLTNLIRAICTKLKK